MYPYQSKTVATPGQYVPSAPAQTNCYNYTGTVQCQTTGGGGGYQEAPTYSQVDGNSGSRDEYWRTCMATKGWYKVYVDGASKSPPVQQAGSQVTRDADVVSNLRNDAERGNPSAMNNLGAAYAQGKGGLPKDEVMAYAWYKKAADAGDPYGQLNVADYLIKGKAGVSKDVATAFSLLQKAASKGIPQAQNNLGWCYEYGMGAQRNFDEAVRWYRTAAGNGHTQAAENLKRLQKR